MSGKHGHFMRPQAGPREHKNKCACCRVTTTMHIPICLQIYLMLQLKHTDAIFFGVGQEREPQRASNGWHSPTHVHVHSGFNFICLLVLLPFEFTHSPSPHVSTHHINVDKRSWLTDLKSTMSTTIPIDQCHVYCNFRCLVTITVCFVVEPCQSQ